MNGHPFLEFQVFPRLPERLGSLIDLAYNLHWAWNHETISLFRRMDLDLWESTRHNPVLMLGTITQERLEALARDESFLSHMDRAAREMRACETTRGWYQRTYGQETKPFVAYFSMEFGLTECIPNYSGGLGVLSGDHLKSASDLGVPLIGVGLLYQQGYFRQYLNLDGWQQETYPDNDFFNMPLTLETTPDGAPLMIEVEFPQRTVSAQVWRAQVGCTPLYLLDANVMENAPGDRAITRTLYGGDVEMRVMQEILLGIGGLRALDALGLRPEVCHMNEGHSAFLALERIRVTMAESDCSFAEALTTTKAGNVFTTHTPVAAGIDLFDRQLIEKYFAPYIKVLSIALNDLMTLGHAQAEQANSPFNMALFATHTSAYRNGVSELHGRVARAMWAYDWPRVPESEVPIAHVTNGVHLHSWVSREMSDLLERYLGGGWRQQLAEPEIWRHIDEIPDAELWTTHERRRERLVSFARDHLVTQFRRRGMADHEAARAREALVPSALTLGFARRFATYKRATLLLRDKTRLIRLLTSTDRPLQIIFAGKAHPHDNGGKQLIREIVHFAREAGVGHRLVFLEDYDISVARALVQGVDVWVNTPRRPLEASGTSGMKVVANGGLNLSILDGWWDEAYNRNLGWAIGYGEEYQDTEVQDQIESEELFNILEREVVPLFYSRSSDGLPREWIGMMKCSMRTLCPYFNTDRMVSEYTEKYYVPARTSYRLLHDDKVAKGRALTAWVANVRANWDTISVDHVDVDITKRVYVRQSIAVKAYVRLGKLTSDDVAVDLYLGLMSVGHKLEDGQAVPLQWLEQRSDGTHVYAGELRCEESGLHGFSVRVLPKHEHLVDPYSLRLIYWKDKD
jgi:starch phosphorylase